MAATKKIKPFDGQSIVDIALQEYGSLEGIFALAQENELSVDSAFYQYAGTLAINSGNVVRADVVGYYTRVKHKVNTTGENYLFSTQEFSQEFELDFNS